MSLFSKLGLKKKPVSQKEQVESKSFDKRVYTSCNRCVCCGAVIPEGSHVCSNCYSEVENK